MNLQTQEILDKALELGDKERASLAHYLLDSLGESPPQNVEKEWIKLAEKRLSEIANVQERPVEWKVIKDRIKRNK